MFWERYGSVVRWMFATAALVAGISVFTYFAWFAPPVPGDDRFEDAFVIAVWATVAGVVTAVPASIAYRVWLGIWVRRARSVASRAWTGAGAAGLGAALLWSPVWTAALVGVWPAFWFGLAPAVVAMLVAGPLTVRAARRADLRVESAASSVPSEGLA